MPINRYMPKSKEIPESFSVDHRTMTAPQVRRVGLITGPVGDKISKFDLRFFRPNVECLPTAAVHTLEHLLAMYLREHLDGVIDVSPMGCRTGFYLSVWGDVSETTITEALTASLRQILQTDWDTVPGVSEKECGNYRDHSLFSAKEFAERVLEGFTKP